MVKVVKNKAEFDTAVGEAGGKLVVVDFYADWCGPCRMISPKIEQMEKDMADVVFLKVDVDEAEDLAAEMKIEAMPTFKMFKNGTEVAMVVGANEENIKQEIEKYK